ncbi:MAG: hypothetical protein ACAH65_10110, partial [Chloroflexota bacterium]
SIGPRMLRITLPHVDAWNVWYADVDNSPAGLEPRLKLVDEVCAEFGRDPGAVERTVAVLVRLPGGRGRVQGDFRQATIQALTGTSREIAAGLRAYAHLGVAEVQLVVDPITLESIETLGGVLQELDSA